MNNGSKSNKVLLFFEWISKRFVMVSIFVVVLAIGMAGISDTLGTDKEPDFAPAGEIYTTQERVEDIFSYTSGPQRVGFLVESVDGGDVLTRDALLEWVTNSATLRADTSEFRGAPVNSHLLSVFDSDLGFQIDGVFSLADAVDDHLKGGLEKATDDEVKIALHELLAKDASSSSLRGTLSMLATSEPGTVAGKKIDVWESPAFQSMLSFDITTVEITSTSDDQDVIDYEQILEAQRWLRHTQEVLRGDQVDMVALGLVIDFDLEFQEQAEEAAPFILGAVVVILLTVGMLIRSYWAAVYVGLGLAVTTMIYRGIFALIGLKGGLLLGFIVPISIISFGVDFFIHANGRVQEAQLLAGSSKRAYPVGLSTVFLAIALAALSSAAAFTSNAASGIEATTQFGIGAAIAILVAFAVLGLLAPKLLLVTEQKLGLAPKNQPRFNKLGHKLGFVFAALIAGAIVASTVQFALMGAIGSIVFALLFIYIPFRFTRRRNARAYDANQELSREVRGIGHGFKAAGTLVHYTAKWRKITIPVVVVMALVGLYGALKVESGFQFSDFLAKDSDAVKSIDKLGEHYGGIGGTGYILVEGDLTEPSTLESMEVALDEVVGADVDYILDFDGDPLTEKGVLSLAQFAVSSSVARTDIKNTTGVSITDTDKNGLPDNSEQIAAVYTHATESGLRDESGADAYSPAQVATMVHLEDGSQSSRLLIVIGSFTNFSVIDDAQEALEAAATNLRSATEGADIEISVSGDSITTSKSLRAFTKAMLVSLPLAIVLTFLIASVALKSFKYAAISVSSILLVVVWVYAFMTVADYSINPVTSTIAAIAIGIGVTFATHFTVRFREELRKDARRTEALRKAGEGTGGALILSALTSIAGFAVLGLSPMPIFAVYGVLTAVMISMAALVSLLVLPSLLVYSSPSLKKRMASKNNK